MSKILSVEELLALKQKLERKRDELSQLKGREEYLMEELKSKYNCLSIEEADDLFAEKSATLEKKKKTLQVKLAELQSEYDYLFN